ncbi:Cysteinyl-tRNA synthetase, putative, expressed [Panicum miliaceum]|uniref:cysteine--tRNA ligase n=1 Tax=Panicum miliaceum TaxID=4540 RepID=A0A3L6S3L3_PANMI|nr:Cysteinyl-tRNA synthetase, putative, expressed [Panicum miliaceum]
MAEKATPPRLVLFNSMTKKKQPFQPVVEGRKEPFKPLVEGKVSMFVCGITPYDLSHVGHARAYVAFDVLYRYLKFLGNEVEYVRNFTDIDNKIIKRANEAGETVESLSSRFINEFSLDMDELQCLPPTREPRVTEHIEHVIELITKKGMFTSFPEYLQLSGRILDRNRAGERVAMDTRKRNPADFALWKSAKEGEPFWESPWGPGRPGWHIECSAMSAHCLGHVFDIHGGGKDLIFPHHENEVAQSRAAYPESEVKCWMHNGFVNKDDQKMSKSENNFFTIRDVWNDLKTTKVLDESFMKLLRTINSDLDDLKVLKQLKGKTLKRACLSEEQLQEQIEERTAARKQAV